jgi:hypothetical protein
LIESASWWSIHKRRNNFAGNWFLKLFPIRWKLPLQTKIGSG